MVPSASVRSANTLSLIGMILGILSAVYAACLYVIIWAIMLSPYNGPIKAVIGAVIGIAISAVSLVISKITKKKGAASKKYKVGVGTSLGGLIASAALLLITLVCITVGII